MLYIYNIFMQNHQETTGNMFDCLISLPALRYQYHVFLKESKRKGATKAAPKLSFDFWQSDEVKLCLGVEQVNKSGIKVEEYLASVLNCVKIKTCCGDDTDDILSLDVHMKVHL